MPTIVDPRVIGSAAIVLAILGVAACGSDAPATPTRTVTATVTQSTTLETTLSSPSAAQSDQLDQETPDDVAPVQAASNPTPCGPRDLSRATIDAAIAKIAPDPLGAWVPGKSDFSTCNDISYAVLGNGGGMSASNDQLLIFGKQGDFLGTGIKCITSRQNVQPAGPDSVRVDYSPDRWITTPDGGHTRPAYPVTFGWNGSRVVMEGTLPYEITHGEC